MNEHTELDEYKGKMLSGAALLGLADAAFYGFTNAEERIGKLGIRLDSKKFKETILSYKKRGFKIFGDLLEFDFPVKPDERSAIGRSLKGLVEFRMSGLPTRAASRVLTTNLYVIFVLIQIKSGNADSILDWIRLCMEDLESEKDGTKDSRNSKENITVMWSTIIGHLRRNEQKPPLIYPEKTKFLCYLAINLITDPNAKPNAKKTQNEED